ncbi:MAG: orotidine 5'-phosphate decarboxylase, partial [Deltaproteobacteria bacterium]|nr:orotidine 5'-phosphate decarboxylase [Deltaproteobacteria bacterium]
MEAKDRLIFPLDVSTSAQALQLVSLLDQHVGVFKIGLELFVANGPKIVEQIAEETAAGIFLDLKLHDIPATVQGAIQHACRLKGVNFITVHCVPKLMEAAVSAASARVKILAVTVLTSLDTSDLLALGIR